MIDCDDDGRFTRLVLVEDEHNTGVDKAWSREEGSQRRQIGRPSSLYSTTSCIVSIPFGVSDSFLEHVALMNVPWL